MGNLSTMIGFLPQDKELHEQRLASRSSSSPDLDEDVSKPQAEQDNLNFQCQHALQETSSNSDDLSFNLVPRQKVVADSGGELYTTSFLLYTCQQPNQLLNTTERASQHDPTTFTTLVEGSSRSKRQSFSHDFLHSAWLCLHETDPRQQTNHYPYLGRELDRSWRQLDGTWNQGIRIRIANKKPRKIWNRHIGMDASSLYE